MNNYIKRLFSGRIDRTEYLGGLFILFILTWFLVSLNDILDVALRQVYQIHTLANPLVPVITLGILFSISILYYLFYITLTFSVHARRLHDWGHSGWWSLTIFVIPIALAVTISGGLIILLPVLILINLVMKGQSGVNKYGQLPTAGKKTLKTIFNP